MWIALCCIFVPIFIVGVAGAIAIAACILTDAPDA